MSNEPNITPAGFWPCTVLSGSAGEETDNNGKPTGRIKARVNVKIDDGPSKGRLVTYEDEVNAKSSLYIGRSLKACGWKEKSLSTVAADLDEWIKKTGGKSTVEIRHIEMKRGKRYEEWVDAGKSGFPIWDKANSIGRGPRPLAAPAAGSLSDADEQMRRAMAEDGGGAPDEQPTPRDPDDIPFVTASASVSLGEIAAVLR